jgi:hypothetical protein
MSVQAAVIALRLAAGLVLGQQRGGGRFASVLTQSDDLAVHHIGEHSPESLPGAALTLIESDMSRSPFHARAIPLREEPLFGAASFLGAHALADGRLTGGHGLTVHADLLP